MTEKFFVYRNLRTGTWSLRNKRGIVVGHPKVIIIKNPTFVVQPAGLKKVRETGKKFVHAGVRGEVCQWSEALQEEILSTSQRVSYNPFKWTSFVKLSDQTPVFSGKFAILMQDNLVYLAE